MGHRRREGWYLGVVSLAVSEQSAAGAEEVSASTEEQSASVEEMVAGAQELAAQATTLQEVVSRFRLEAASPAPNAQATGVQKRRAADWASPNAPQEDRQRRSA